MGKRKVLIVDDDVINRKLLGRMLEDEYEVLEATGGEEALGILAAEHESISAVLLDIVMPETDGYEVLRRMRAERRFAAVPVIVETANTEEDAEIKALSLGANDFITKPYNREVIVHRLSNTINLRETAAIANAAQRDELTGLFNRRTFLNLAAEMIALHAPGYYTMSCLDIDNFKVINDQYGTEMGDCVLRHVADGLVRCDVAVNGIACRINADHFAVLFPTSYLDSPLIAENHRETMRPACINREISIRVGRYIVTDVTLSPSAMYDRASLAMSSVKGRYDTSIGVYDESMRERLLREQQIVTEMHGALTGGQFEPWFQPQYNHATGALIGAEALVRWRRPGSEGLVPPDDFIPVFERNGFIYELDKYVWEQVCILLARWIGEGRNPLPVSVNISRFDLFCTDFFETITGLVERYGIPVGLFRLEVTESAFAKSEAQVIDAVRRLVRYGFTVEIDDFGSGYSSLNTLKDVPATILKLDMKFVEETEDSERGGNILESVVRMAKWIDMAVIAEGVETVEQADYLKSIGCIYIQGYLYAKPMPAADYEALARSVQKEEHLLKLTTVEHLDNNAFWDPASIDTLIFNSYIGGACIFEYHKGSIELLRANDKYAQVIGSAGMRIEDALKLNWTEHMDAENRAAVKEALQSSIATGDEATREIVFLDLPGCPAETYLRSTLRVIASSGSRYLVYCTNENITAERQADRALRETDEQLRFLNETAHDLLSKPDGDRALEGLLARLLAYFGGNRAYIFELDLERKIANNTYEACAPGVKSERENLQNVPFSALSFWLHAFRRQDYISIADVDALPEDRREERETLAAQGIGSLIAVPFRRDGALIGFIGVDDPKRQRTRVDRLAALGDYITAMLTGRNLAATIARDNETLQTLMNDTPGGFCRIAVADGPVVRMLYANDGFCKLVGMSHEEAVSAFGTDYLSGVHPDDVEGLREEYRSIGKKKGAFQMKYRIRHGSAGYVSIMAFGKIVADGAGETLVNAYYTDVSEETRKEEEQKELLDNLPCGAALYEYDGKTLDAVHINRRYGELVKRDVENMQGASVIAAVHPDDRGTMQEELRLAIQEGRDANCSLRVRYGTVGEQYRRFRVVGRIVPKADGTYAVYAAYSLETDEVAAFQQMLPLALAAVMESTNEISFVKDKSLHYICCSRAFAKLAGLENEQEIIGKTDDDLVDAALAAQYRAVDTEIIEGRQARLDYEEVLPSSDGTAHYATTSKYPLLDAAGNVIGIYGVGRDMTEYRTAFERLRLLTDSIPGGIASFEVTKERIRLTYCNEGYYAFSGYDRAEYMEKVAENPLFLVFEKDLPTVYAAVKAVAGGDVPELGGSFRCRTRDGGYRWFNLTGRLAAKQGDTAYINAVQYDITEQKEAEERLRMSEEQFRIAAALGDRTVARYDIRKHSYYNDSPLLFEQGFPRVIENAPEAFLDAGIVESHSVDDFVELYRQMQQGAESATATVALRIPDGSFRWFRIDATAIFDADGDASEAILVFYDVTEQREKEAAYKKWQQSLAEKSPASYTLFRCNLSKSVAFDSVEGSLLKVHFDADATTFDERTAQYAEQYVYADDRAAYMAALRADTLFANYYRGKRTETIEYREIVAGGGVRWLRLSVELIEYPDSTDIEAYLMYEDIDASKQEELQTRARAETDPLTGIFNRVAFAERMNALIRERRGAQIALMMLDIDGFKLVNDSFGHAMGDKVLKDIAAILRGALRHGDLVARLGGDEFVVCLENVPDRALVGRKAQHICGLLRKTFSVEVQTSASIGVAMCPDDGADFDALYHKADTALYHVKATGKDHYAFYSADMKGEAPKAQDVEAIAKTSDEKREPRRRMLIVEDNRTNREVLVKIFENEFIIDTADDGNSALIRLRRYGASISVVLLDLIMPGMDGFAVLEKMRASAEMQTIPVIVVSGADERETSLRTIKCGATDFVTKPVDPELLRLRVQSAVSKAENERLRAENGYLALQSNELAIYRAILSRAHTAIAEYDTESGMFTYGAAMGELISGRFNDRDLWEILSADGTADKADAERLHALILRVAGDGDDPGGDMKAKLKTPAGDARLFSVHVIRRQDAFQLADKLVVSFTEAERE